MRLGDIVDIRKGKKAPEEFNSKISDDAKRYIQIKDIRSDEEIRYAIAPKGVCAELNDILIVWDGANSGEVGSSLSGYVGSTLARLRIMDLYREQVYVPYLTRFLQSKFDLLNTQTTGATIPHVSKEILINLEIPLPPLEQQRFIADVLDKADALRKKRLAALAKLDDLLKSVFLDMFGDPVTNPKGWESTELSNVADAVSGVTKGRKLEGKKTVEVPYMRVANVQDGHLVLDEVKTIKVLPSDVEKYQLLPGDLLLTEGGDPDKLGRGTVWNGEVPNCIHQNHIFRVRITSDIILPEYLSTLIGSTRGKRYFLRAGKQTTGIATINKTQLKSFPLLLPPVELQKDYKRLIKRHSEQVDRLRNNLKTFDDLFNSLQQRAFKGELTPAEAAKGLETFA